MKEKITKLVNVYKKYGFKGFMKKLKAYLIANYFDQISFKVIFNSHKYHQEIKNILEKTDYERIILWRSSFGYNVPLFQRPQHIARELSKQNCLVFYEVTTMTDHVKIIKKLTDKIYLTNFNNRALNKILKEELALINKPKYVQLYSTDWKLSVKDIENYLYEDYGFIYEYIDHLSPELAGTKDLPLNIIEKYEYVMSHDNVYIVVTADLLKEDVLKKRGKKNLAFAENGVEYAFWQDFSENYELDAEYQKILALNKPILMYYGALASWFDYDLVKKIAQTNKYSIVLIGIKYDDSFNLEKMEQEKNVYFLGPKDYKVLKYYARKASVLLLPFKICDITKATSPCKLFEYMALNIPIVTTDLNECRKYESVLIGKSHEDFLKKIDKALTLKNDSKYKEILNKEALDNDWSKKAKVIIDLIKKDEE